MPSATVKLSIPIIKGTPPEPQRYELSDTEVKGLRLRVFPSGVKSFVLMYTTKEGKKVRYTIGKWGSVTLERARKLADAKLAEVQLGGDPQAEKRDARQKAAVPTLRKFVDGHYAEHHRTHFRSADKTLARLRVICEEFGDTPLDQITAWNFEKWRAKRIKAGKSKVTANRDLEAIKAALTKAVLWNLIPQNPLADVKRVKTDASAKVRYLSTDEEKRLRKALRQRQQRLCRERESANEWRRQRGRDELPALGTYADHLEPMILVSVNTGLRQGELFNLHWSNVNLPARLLTVEGAGAKSSQTRHIPLNDEAHSVLKAWKEQQTDTAGLVFPSIKGRPFQTVKTGWGALLEAAEITGFRWHDLRHTFASKLVMAGVDLNTVRELLGHSDLKMTLRYAHLAPEHKAAAVAKLSGAI